MNRRSGKGCQKKKLNQFTLAHLLLCTGIRSGAEVKGVKAQIDHWGSEVLFRMVKNSQLSGTVLKGLFIFETQTMQLQSYWIIHVWDYILYCTNELTDFELPKLLQQAILPYIVFIISIAISTAPTGDCHEQYFNISTDYWSFGVRNQSMLLSLCASKKDMTMQSQS